MATTKATTLAHTLGGISSDISTAEINRLDGVTGDLQTQLDAKLATATASSTYAPLASPDFTGTVDLTGTTVNFDNDSISGNYISGGEIGQTSFPNGHILQTQIQSEWLTSDKSTNSSTFQPGFSVDFTPAQSSSNFIFTFNSLGVWLNGSSNNMKLDITVTTTDNDTTTHGGSNSILNQSADWTYSASGFKSGPISAQIKSSGYTAGTAYRARLYFKSTDGATIVYLVSAPNYYNFIVHEVKA